MFPLNIPIVIQDAIVAALFVGAAAIFVRSRFAKKSESGGACHACGAADSSRVVPGAQTTSSVK